MAIENNLAVFSLRLPRALAAQIDARKAISRRNRNAEIVLLLEMAIDMLVSNDQKILTDMATKVLASDKPS